MNEAIDTTLDYIELEYAWNEAKLDEHQRMACFPDEYKKWAPGEIARLRDKKYQLNNLLPAEKDREWRKIFQDQIQDKIDDINKILRGLNMSTQARKEGEADLAAIKLIPITNFYTGKLRRMGKVLAGLCPFHQEKTGSFRIYPATNTWHCFGCGAGNDVVDFIMKLKNVDFNEALKLLQ